MTSIKVVPRYVDHLWYPILVPMGGYNRIVEMQGRQVNEWNDNMKAGGEIHSGDGGYSIGTEEAQAAFARGRVESRIQGLIDRAIIRVNNPFVNSNGEVVCDNWEKGVSMSKLVKLVAEECANICGKDSLDGRYIKSQFGVEE
jgi:hypothetical protein